MGIAVVRFNMTSVTGGHAAFLASDCLVDSITYNGVGFSMPSGILRVNDDTVFTHFAARIAGEWRVFEIKGIHAINGAVIEYNYELDYVKDCMLNTYDFTRSAPPEWFYSPIIDRIRDTNGTISDSPIDFLGANEFADDPLFKFSGVVHPSEVTIGYLAGRASINEEAIYALVLSKIRAADGLPFTYLLRQDQLDVVINYLNTSPYAAAFYKQIMGCYLVPNGCYDMSTSAYNIEGVSYATLPLSYAALDDSGNVFSDTILSECTAIHCAGIKGSSTTECRTKFQSSQYVTVHDFIYKEHVHNLLYVPYVGVVPLSNNLGVVNNGSYVATTYQIYINFKYNFADGTFAISLPNSKGLYGQNYPLPSVVLPSGATAFSYYSNQQQMKSVMATGIMSTAVSAATGNVAGVIGGAVGMVNNVIHADISNDLVRATGQNYSIAAGWDGEYDKDVKYVYYIELPVMTFGRHAATVGYVCGKPLANITQDVTDIIGLSFKFNNESQVAAFNNRYEWQKPLENAMRDEFILFNTPYTLNT